MPGKVQKKKSTRSASTGKKASSGSAKRVKNSSKHSAKSRTANSKTVVMMKRRRRRESAGILTIAFSVLFTLSIYCKGATGLFGEIILHITTGMFGFVAFLMPPLVLVYGVLLIFCPQRPQVRNKIRLIFLLFVLIGAIFNAGSYNKSDYVNMTFFQCLKFFYQKGRSVAEVPRTFNGGVAGGLISIPLCFVFQKTGTIIVLGAFSIIVAMMVTELSIKKVTDNTVEKVKTIRENHKAEIELIDLDENDEDDDDDVDQPVFAKKHDQPFIELKEEKKESRKGKIIDFPIEQTEKEQESEKPDNITETDNIAETERTDNADKAEMPEITAMEIPVQINNKKAEQKLKQHEDMPETEARKIPLQDCEYHFPPFSCLNAPDENEQLNTRKLKQTALENARKLEDTLTSFGISAQIVNVAVGPAFTRYEVQPSPGVKVSRIVNLTDDIALNLAAQGIRIEAPIPGKAAVGIEVPNPEVAPIMLREVIETPEFINFKSKLAVGLGKDISGENVIIDLDKMPHLLIAGATGSGKSVCINSIIVSLLYKATPEEVKLLMIDPKVVELGVYNGIPHLLIPVVTDPSKAAGALQWAVQEMVTRYKLFAEKGVRDVKGYNKAIEEAGEGFKLPQIVIIIDELADLMMVAPHDVEDSICRLAQMARAAGMHLVVATQRPSVNVITGVIKANIPSRIAFAVSSQVDSRTILDMGGAEKLLGKGDMLYFPVGLQKPVRVKGCFISDKEIENVVEYIKNQITVEYDENIMEQITAKNDDSENPDLDADELLPQAIDLVVECGQASVSLIQRRFRVGYARAGRIIDQMAERGIISGFEGSKPRRVLISKEQWEEMKSNI